MDNDYDEFSYEEDDYNPLEECQTILYSSEIISEENNKKIEEYDNHESLHKGLNTLDKKNLLTQPCFDAIITCRQPDNAAAALVALNRKGIITPKNISVLKYHTNPLAIAELLILVKDTELSLGQLQNHCPEIFTHPALTAIINAIAPWKNELLTTEESYLNIKTLQETAFPREVATILAQLYTTDIFNGEHGAVNRIKIATHFNLKELITAISSCMPLFNTSERYENFTALITHINPIDVAAALLKLHINQLLNNENLEALLVSTQHLEMIANAFILLNENNCLNPLTRSLVIAAVTSDFERLDTSSFISKLFETELLETPSDVPFCLAIINHRDLFKAFEMCKANSFSIPKELRPQNNEEIFFIIKGSLDPEKMAQALVSLCKANITPINYYLDALKMHPQPDLVTNLVIILKDTTLLSGENAQENLEILKNFSNSRSMLIAFRQIFFLDKPQDYFNLIMKIHVNIFCYDGLKFDWARVPKDCVRKKHLNDILALIDKHEEKPLIGFLSTDIQKYIQENLTPIYRENKYDAVNSEASTFVSSIGESVRESALKLKNRYNLQENEIEHELQNITTWINQFEDLPIKKLKRRKQEIICLNRLKDKNQIRIEKLSIRQLLAYAWRAIHDDTCWVNCTNSENHEKALEEARCIFFEGLYECQTEESNLLLCDTGIFNKIIEKLAGIHIDITLRYITLQNASWKLQVIVKEEFKSYLESIKKNQNAEEWRILSTNIAKDDTDAIWNKISSKVTERVKEEFSILFTDELKLTSFCYDGRFALSIDVLNLFEQHDQPVSYATNPHILYSPKKHHDHQNEPDNPFQSTEKASPTTQIS